jgi:N-carbamoyl-L-amino-acid hydrolase
VRFSFRGRSQSKETLEAFYDLFLSECQLVGEQRGVEFKLDRGWKPRRPSWMLAGSTGCGPPRVRSACRTNRCRAAPGTMPRYLPMQRYSQPAMIFVRNQNGSHNPDEAMEIDDFVSGVAVMSAALQDAAG